MRKPNLINEKIRLIRIVKGFKQDDVSKQLGITQRAYSKIETGETKVNVDLIEKLSSIFQMEAQDILNFNPETFIQTNATYNSQSGGNNNFTVDKSHVESLKSEIDFLRIQLKEKDVMIKSILKVK